MDPASLLLLAAPFAAPVTLSVDPAAVFGAVSASAQPPGTGTGSAIEVAANSTSAAVLAADLDGAAVAGPQDDFNDRLKSAGDDVDKLWTLYEWTQEDKKREKHAKRVLTKILKVDAEHEGARAALGHVFFDEKWFESERELADYKKKRAKELGLVEWKGEWVEADDLPFLKRGWQKDDLGRWHDPEVKRKLAEGWVQQDGVWVSPEEKGNIEKGLWKCGDKWLSLADANAYHAELGRPWVIVKDRAEVWSYADRATAEKALDIANKAFFDVAKVTDFSTEVPIPFALTRGQSQFLAFCDGDPATRHPQLDPRALSSQLRATFADLWFDFDKGVYRGMGATFWDPAVEHADAYAVHDVRMAYALSCMETLDPANGAIADVLARKQVEPQFAVDRLQDRKLPQWIHWGVASYASRWFVDTTTKTGGNARWAIDWSTQNIRNQGGLDPISTILDCDIAPDNNESNKLVNEAGLIVAFCVEGGVADVTQKWRKVFEDLRSGGDVKSSLTALRKALLQNEAAIRAFAKL